MSDYVEDDRRYMSSRSAYATRNIPEENVELGLSMCEESFVQMFECIIYL